MAPRVAILSFSRGAQIRRADALEVTHSSPGLEDLWQTQRITAGAEKAQNAPEQFIANLDDRGERPLYIKVSARADGSFTIMNSRNQYRKEYAAK